MKRFVLLILYLIFLSFPPIFSQSFFGINDTLKIFRTAMDITVDGQGLEKCWDSTNWVYLQYQWMNTAIITDSDIRVSKLGVDTNNFQGRFKILWSSKTNRLYILAKITDNILWGGYVFPNSNYPDFDDIEIFYKEGDMCRQTWSVCDHEFTQNAKAIHLTNNLYAVDINGTSWADVNYIDYIELMQAVLNKTYAPDYTWEIGMYLITDSVKGSEVVRGTPFDTNRIGQLTVNKVFGFTLNYCDADNGSGRNGFYSNLYLPNGSDSARSDAIAERNASWVDASLFGTAELIGYSNILDSTLKTTDTTQHQSSNTQFTEQDICIYPNPVKNNFNLVINDLASSKIALKITDILGTIVIEKIYQDMNTIVRDEFSLSYLPSGIYFVKISMDGQQVVKKLVKE